MAPHGAPFVEGMSTGPPAPMYRHVPGCPIFLHCAPSGQPPFFDPDVPLPPVVAPVLFAGLLFFVADFDGFAVEVFGGFAVCVFFATSTEFPPFIAEETDGWACLEE